MGELLHEPRLDHSFYCRAHFRGAFGVAVSKSPFINIYFVAAGTAWLTGQEPMQLGPGDLAFLFDGRAHVVASLPGEPGVPQASLPVVRIGPQSSQLTYGAAGQATVMLLGRSLLEPSAHPLRSLLPRAMVLRQTDASRTARTHLLLSTLRDELTTPRLGSETFVTRTMELVLLDAVREWSERCPEARTGWLGALRDPQLGGVLALMHRRSHHAFTVDELSAQAGMSKSVFCERFRAALGVPPLRYITEVRMQLAARLLTHERLSVAEAAERLGYGSEAAFSRAFKRVLGVSPGQSRRARW